MVEPKNINYAAVVFEVKSIVELENCDNVVAISVFGFHAIVSKDTKVGDVGLFFPAEVQLSDEFCKANNLYRHSEKNADPDQKGYMEDNRRVRAMKFRGNKSNALFMKLDCLENLGLDISKLKVGDTFDELEGVEICKKYEVYRREPRQNKYQAKERRVDKLHMPEHYDTAQYYRNKDMIKPDDHVYITQKLHGTSIRIGNVLTKRKLSVFEKFAKYFGAKVETLSYEYNYGSRKVIKDPENADQIDYYGEDIWCAEGAKLQGLIPEGFVVYAELVGYTASGKAIQQGYTYGYKPNECGLYVYRVAQVNVRGFITDLTWPQVKEFCEERGIKYVPEMDSCLHKDFEVEDWMEFVYAGFKRGTLPLSDEGTVDEGVCIRRDGLVPMILKAKCEKFYEYETSLLDAEVEDMETSGEEV